VYSVGDEGLYSKLLYVLLYKNINSDFTELMTHMTHKMPKAAYRLGYRVGQMGRFLTATICPFPPQKNPKINAKQSLTFIFVSL
jgi:hypothetical protein